VAQTTIVALSCCSPKTLTDAACPGQQQTFVFMKSLMRVNALARKNAYGLVRKHR